MCGNLQLEGWLRWRAHIAGLGKAEKMVRRCLARLVWGTIARAWGEWVQRVAWFGRARGLMTASVLRMRRSLLWSGWQGWWAAVDRYHEQLHLSVGSDI